MKIIAKFLGFLLVLAITVTSLAYVVSSTLLEGDYLGSKAGETDLYAKLAERLPDLLVAENTNPVEVRAVLSDVATERYVESKLSAFFDGLEAYYKEDALAPTLNLREIEATMSSYGVQLPTNSPIAEPMRYQDPKGFHGMIKALLAAMIWGPVAILALVVLIVLVARGRSRYIVLAKACLFAAFLHGLLYAIILTLPQLTSLFFPDGSTDDQITPVLSDFLKALADGAGALILQVAAGLVVAAIGLLLGALIAKLVRRTDKETSTKPASASRPRLR